jgi:hypothetical protein
MSETTAITSGTEKNQYGLYPAIEDYLALEYMPSMLHLVEMNLGNTGDNLRIFKDASVWVNTIYQQATNNGVTSNYKGVITDDAGAALTEYDAGNIGAALTAYQTIFGSDDGTWEGTLYYKFKDFVMNSGKLSYSVYTNLKQTLDDMDIMYNNLGGVDTVFTASATTTDQNSAYYWWYEGQLAASDTITSPVYSIESQPSEGIATVDSSGNWTYNPYYEDAGGYATLPVATSFILKITEANSGISFTRKIAITVGGKDDTENHAIASVVSSYHGKLFSMAGEFGGVLIDNRQDVEGSVYLGVNEGLTQISTTNYNRLSTQENLINSIYSVESISIQEQAILRQVMFLYENYLKSASSLLAGIDQAIQSLAVNVRST